MLSFKESYCLGFLQKQQKSLKAHVMLRSNSYFSFFLHTLACGVVDPPPGIEPRTLAVKGWSPNHCPAGESPYFSPSAQPFTQLLFCPVETRGLSPTLPEVGAASGPWTLGTVCLLLWGV